MVVYTLEQRWEVGLRSTYRRFRFSQKTVNDKCYADKPETIDALKDNIREAMGEIQLHTIDNVLKNWTDRVGCCMPSQGSHLNKIHVHNWSLQPFSQDY